MKIGNKIFPYPILNHTKQLSSYKDKNFDVVFSIDNVDNKIIIRDVRFVTDSELLDGLYDEGKIDVIGIVECSDTVFRKKYRITRDPQNIILYKADLSERIYVTFFAYATQDFNMSSNEFDDDYQGINFEIEKYDIVAACDDGYFDVRHSEKENDIAHSIFSIINDHGNNNGTYVIDSSGKKIVIYLSDEDYKQYRIISNINENREIFFNMLLIPALIDSIKDCQEECIDGTDIDTLCEKHRWFSSIVRAYKRTHNGEMLTEDTFKTIKAIELSQEVLGKPLNTSFVRLIERQIEPRGDE